MGKRPTAVVGRLIIALPENQLPFSQKLGKVAKHRGSVCLNEGSPGIDLCHGAVQSLGRNTVLGE